MEMSHLFSTQFCSFQMGIKEEVKTVVTVLPKKVFRK